MSKRSDIFRPLSLVYNANSIAYLKNSKCSLTPNDPLLVLCTKKKLLYAYKVMPITFNMLGYSICLDKKLAAVSTTLTSTSPTECTFDKTIIEPIGSPFAMIGATQYDFTCSY